jgi:hypothetical protein
MADVTVNIDSNGSANDPGVEVGQTIQWQLDSGVAGPFDLYPPHDVFKDHDSPGTVTLSSSNTTSPTYTVKPSAGVGGHTYTISAGPGTYHSGPPTTGAQTITVDTSMGKAAHR